MRSYDRNWRGRSAVPDWRNQRGSIVDIGNSEAARLDICRKLAAMRKAVNAAFGDAFSPAPCLDMLVDLFIAEREGRDVYIWSLCVAAGIPFSTAHRRVAMLEKNGFVVREEPRGDRRRIGVRMTRQGNGTMIGMLDSFARILA